MIAPRPWSRLTNKRQDTKTPTMANVPAPSQLDAIVKDIATSDPDHVNFATSEPLNVTGDVVSNHTNDILKQEFSLDGDLASLPESTIPNVPKMVYSSIKCAPGKHEGGGLIFEVPTELQQTLQSTSKQLAAATGTPLAGINARELASEVMRGHAAFSNLNKALITKSSSGSAEYFVVLLNNGLAGIGLNVVAVPPTGSIQVSSFQKNVNGSIGTAEACKRISIGDELLSINEVTIQSLEEFKTVAAVIRTTHPVRLKFRRGSSSTMPNVPSSPKPILTRLLLNDPQHFSKGSACKGVRYIGPQRYAAEVALPLGGIRRLGEFKLELDAAKAYNVTLATAYGAKGSHLKNFIAPYPGAEKEKQIVYFTAVQKAQLRSQIMTFKFLASAQEVPHSVLIDAIKMGYEESRALLQRRMANKSRKFNKRAPVGPVVNRTSKGRKRGRKRKKKKNKYDSDESSDEDEDSDEDYKPVGVPTQPSRRSGRNVGRDKKKYNDEDFDKVFEELEANQPVPEAVDEEEDIGPKVDQVLGVRYFAEDPKDEAELQYLIKWKNISYGGVTWETEENLEVHGRWTIQRLRRYVNLHQEAVNNAAENIIYKGHENQDDTVYFNPSYLEVDRILDMRDWEEEIIAPDAEVRDDENQDSTSESVSAKESPSKAGSDAVAPTVNEDLSVPKPRSNEESSSVEKPVEESRPDDKAVSTTVTETSVPADSESYLEKSPLAANSIEISSDTVPVVEPSSATKAEDSMDVVKGKVNDAEKPLETGESVPVVEPSSATKAEDSMDVVKGKVNDVEKPLETGESVPVVEPSSATTAKDSMNAPKKMRKGRQYLVKWQNLSYSECTWEWEDTVKEDRKVAEYHRFNHPPIVNGAHPAMLSDVRPPPSSYAKYSESPTYSNGNKLRSYQLESLNWMNFCWYNRRNCILADEMGLGKTIQALSVLEHLRLREHVRGPFLVVAPLATLGNWKREIESWTNMNCLLYHDSGGGAETRQFIREHEFYYKDNEEYYRRRSIYKFNVLVTSYNILLSDASIFESIHWRYVCVDEAHKLKNRDSKILQVMQNFSWDSCLLMTGTPLQNGVFELWSLLNFIEPQKFPSQQEFYDRFGDLVTAEQVAALHEELRPYMLRRVKEDVEKSIPPKEETIIDVELTTLQKKYYRAIFDRNRSFLSSSKGPMASLVNVEMELRKCCNHPFLIRGVEDKECSSLTSNADRMKTVIQASGKTVLLDKMLNKFRSEGKKLLIFSQFKMMLDVLEDMLALKNYKYERMDGNVKGNDRQNAIDRFNDKESDVFVFLLSTRAGGVGINLIAASVVILFDSDWNPQNDLQAVARCHRIGQTKSVQIYRLVTTKTYEAQMFGIASKKLGMHHAVFETGGVRSGFNDDDDENNSGMQSLMSLDRNKIEMMIRYGAYAIMEDESEADPENKKINNVDIDQLLSKSRTIRYDENENNADGNDKSTENDVENDDDAPKKAKQNGGASSALSFSKATFISETSDSTIDFTDEKFWEKVLGPKLIEKLSKKMQEGFLKNASAPELKEYLTELRSLGRAVVKERQKGEALQDSDQILAILVELKVMGPITTEVNVRDLASEWLTVIEKPKRRRNASELTEEIMYHPFLDGEKPERPSAKKKRRGGKKKNTGDDGAPKKRGRKPKSKSGIVISITKDDDDQYEVTEVRSSVKSIQAAFGENSSDSASESSEYQESEEEISPKKKKAKRKRGRGKKAK